MQTSAREKNKFQEIKCNKYEVSAFEGQKENNSEAAWNTKSAFFVYK